MFKRKNKKHDVVNTIAIDNTEFLNGLNHTFSSEIIPEVEEEAKNLASKDLPHLDSKSTVHFDFIKTRFDRLVLDYKSQSHLNEQSYTANKNISEFKKLRARLVEKLQRTKNDLRIKERAFENLQSFRQCTINERKSRIGVALLTGTEAIFASSSFQIFSQNLLFSLIIGATFSVALYFSATLGAKLLRKARNRYQFFGIFLCVELIIGSVFATLGHFRIVYLEQISGNSHLGNTLSVCEFAGIQLFLFTCAILLKFFFMRTREEKESYGKWKDAKNDISKLKDRQGHLERSMSDLESGLDRTLITRRSLISKAADVELKINGLYRDACSRFIQVNLHRRDTKDRVPICFENPEKFPKLTLFFQDPKLLEFNEADLDSYE